MRLPPFDGVLSFAVGVAVAVAAVRWATPIRERLVPLLRVTEVARRNLDPSVYVIHAAPPPAPAAAPPRAAADVPVAAVDAPVAADAPIIAADAPVAAAVPPAAATAAAPAVERSPDANDSTAPPPEHVGGAQLQTAAIASPAPPAAPGVPTPEATAVPVADLDGWWLVTHSVEATAHAAWTGQRLVYRLQLRQDGDQITGKGSTWAKNGVALTPAQKTPVSVTGTRRAEGIRLLIEEHGRGAVREVSLEWPSSPAADRFAGRFASAATKTFGISEATREPGGVTTRAPRRAGARARSG